MLNSVISEEEVTQAIRNLKSGKTSGTDGILAEMLKAGGTNIIHFWSNCLIASSILEYILMNGQKRSSFLCTKKVTPI